MQDFLYFPRLQRATARSMLADYVDLSVSQLRERAALESAQSYWYPTAPTSQRATTSVLDTFQGSIRDIAAKHGYPRQLGGRSTARGEFDREVVGAILKLTPMLPVEAAQEAVWSFLSLVVLPDVALWRWPNEKQRDDYERILGYPRNVFRRLWWRALILGTEDASVGAKVYEDEAVAILERTTIAGDRRLAKAVAETHLGRLKSSAKRTDIMRDAMKRIRRLHAFTSFQALHEAELLDVVREVFDEAEKSLFS